MKSICLTLGLALGTAFTGNAQEVSSDPKPPVTAESAKPEKPATDEGEEIKSGPITVELIQELEKSGPQSGTIGSETEITAFSNGINVTNVPFELKATNQLTTIDYKGVEINGTLTPAIKRRSVGSFLQLFNPFAPSDYGGNSEAKGEKGFSRAFADPTTTEPKTVLIGIGASPKPADQ